MSHDRLVGKLVWLDLETTGTDAEADPILEIAAVLTGGPEFAEAMVYEQLVVPAGGITDSLISAVSPVVAEMHSSSGLWDAVRERGVPRQEAEAGLIERLRSFGDPGDFVLAGSGVSHFDRRFLDAQMPALAHWFRYYAIDVGVLRRSLLAIGRGDLVPEETGPKAHRALADVRQHIAEMWHYRNVLAT